jgi:acyl carrier protein
MDKGKQWAIEASDELLRARLLEIWSDALEKPVTDPEATFFDNEGNSLGATIVLITIQDNFSVEVTLEEFFDDSTISGLIRSIRRHLSN